jgi:UDP-N-acetylglucosamine 2-epimerase (non-hydrolysing)/UDP-GlcNAc3NAcA epimerase
MLSGIEDILLKEKPDALMVYGDTNSTFAGAFAASKLLMHVIHIEAGLRSFNKAMPEEQNRILTDHISDYLFCSTPISVSNLKNEGITNNVYMCGDVMCDAVLYYSENQSNYEKSVLFSHLNPLIGDKRTLKKWYLATIHRAENTDVIEKLEQILSAFEELDYPVVFSVHPRSSGFVRSLYERHRYTNIYFTEPMGYLDMLYFTKNAVKVVTDSGGLQKEAYILNTPCITVRDQTEWTETLEGGFNILSKPQKNDILEKIKSTDADESLRRTPYGNGDAVDKICEVISNIK